jgi:hypothetical protein
MRNGRSRKDVLVARANHRFWAFLEIPGSSDCSEADTDPQGYSAPTPIPRKKLGGTNQVNCVSLPCSGSIAAHRITLSIVNKPPTLPLAPAEQADKKENRATMPVALIYRTTMIFPLLMKILRWLSSACVPYQTSSQTCRTDNLVIMFDFVSVEMNSSKVVSDEPKVNIPTIVPAKAKLLSVLL